MEAKAKIMGRYVQTGDVIDYTNGTAETIEAGELVSMGYLCGVAAAPIAAGETGALHIVGIFELTKPKELDVKAGDRLCIKTSKLQKHADGDSPCGIAVADASTTVETVLVKINV